MCDHRVGSFTSLCARSVDGAQQQDHGNTSLSQFILLLTLWSLFFTFSVYVCLCVAFLFCSLLAQPNGHLPLWFFSHFEMFFACGWLYLRYSIYYSWSGPLSLHAAHSTNLSLSLSLSFLSSTHTTHLPGGRCWRGSFIFYKLKDSFSTRDMFTLLGSFPAVTKMLE
jgi:hypothetical protein